MRWFSKHGVLLITGVVLALCARNACATTIQDLVRIKGHEENILTGLGIVVGLDGTGDTSKNSYLAARPYARLLTNLGNPLGSLEELDKADAYALVQVTIKVPATGAREGDLLDVHVEKLFNASSLKGGRLVFSLLRLPVPDAADAVVFARAEGALTIEGDDLSSAVIRRGGKMLRDVRTSCVTKSGHMWLVLRDEYAGYPMATMLESIINEELGQTFEGGAPYVRNIASVEDAKNIRIALPESDRERPARFISVLMTRSVDPSLIHTQTPARIVINEKAGTIAITGNVELGPVAITHKDMQLMSITAPAGGDNGWVGLDTTDGASRNSTRLDDLLAAFKQLNVPTADQIAIIFELKKTGALHAEIKTE
jgi:flagellar P-ring protein precursor FlgI